MSSSGRRAADGLLKLNADATTQQVMVNAWARGDISGAEMASALRTYNGLDSTNRQSLQRIVRKGGPEAAVGAGRTSDEALEAIFDSDVSEVDQALALRRMDNLDNRDAAETLLTETDGDASSLFADIEADELDGLLASGCSVSGSASVSHAPLDGGAGVGPNRVFSMPSPSVVPTCDLDVEFLNKIDNYNDQVDSFDAQDFARKYGDLDGDAEVRFRELAKNERYGDSWVRVVGSADIDSNEVRKALDRVEEIGDEAKLQRFKTGQDVNREFPDDYEDPYPSDSIVVEFETGDEKTYFRAHGPDNQIGGFIAQKSTITDSSGEWLSASEIADKLSLKDTPSSISKVEVPEGYQLRSGEIKANFGGSQGATQIELIDDEFIPKDNFQLIKELSSHD
jgi:hypothetical protein